MDFHGNPSIHGYSHSCTWGSKPTLQLRFHVFALQHGGTRALGEIKKFKTLAKATPTFQLYFPIHLPETLWLGFSSDSLREHQSEKAVTLCTQSLANLLWFKTWLCRGKPLTTVARQKAGTATCSAHTEYDALGGAQATGLSWHIPAVIWQGVEYL